MQRKKRKKFVVTPLGGDTRCGPHPASDATGLIQNVLNNLFCWFVQIHLDIDNYFTNALS